MVEIFSAGMESVGSKLQIDAGLAFGMSRALVHAPHYPAASDAAHVAADDQPVHLDREGFIAGRMPSASAELTRRATLLQTQILHPMEIYTFLAIEYYRDPGDADGARPLSRAALSAAQVSRAAFSARCHRLVRSLDQGLEGSPQLLAAQASRPAAESWPTIWCAGMELHHIDRHLARQAGELGRHWPRTRSPAARRGWPAARSGSAGPG